MGLILVPTQSVLRIFAGNFVQTYLGATGSGSFRKKMLIIFFFLPKRLIILYRFEGLWWSGHIFDASASPRSLNKKQAMSPSSTVHGGQYDTTYVTVELILHAALVADEIWDDMLEPARSWLISKYKKEAFCDVTVKICACGATKRDLSPGASSTLRFHTKYFSVQEGRNHERMVPL